MALPPLIRQEPESQVQNATFGPNQSRVFTSDARFIVALGGQRGGKTTVGAYWSVDQAYKMRTEQTARGEKKVPPAGLIVAPTYDQLNHATLLRFFEEFPQLHKYYKQYQKEIRIPIGIHTNPTTGKKEKLESIIFTRSVEDPDNVKGIRAWWVWFDEADGGRPEAWEMVKGRISDHEDGKILITSTIYRSSWINRLIYQPILAGKLERAEIITWPSIERTGFPKSEWDQMRKEMDPVVFARDYESKFVFESGLVYGEMTKYGIIDAVPEGVKMLATFFGLDYGVNHPSAVLYMGYGSDQNWYVIDEHVQEGMNVDQINEVLQNMLDLYRPQHGDPWATYYDPAGGVAVHSILPDVFPIAAIKDIPGRITLIRNLIFQKRVYCLSKCYRTIRELSLYAFDPVRNQPVDRDNHAMDALGYVIHNGWANVDGLASPEPERKKNRIELDLEARGLLKDGVFQTIVASDDYYLF